MDETQLTKIKQEIAAAHDKVKKEIKNDSILYSWSAAGLFTGLIGTSFFLRSQKSTVAIASAMVFIASGTIILNKIKNLTLNKLQEQEYERITIAISAVQKEKA